MNEGWEGLPMFSASKLYWFGAPLVIAYHVIAIRQHGISACQPAIQEPCGFR